MLHAVDQSGSATARWPRAKFVCVQRDNFAQYGISLKRGFTVDQIDSLATHVLPTNLADLLAEELGHLTLPVYHANNNAIEF